MKISIEQTGRWLTPAICTFILAACGGGGGGSDSSTPAIPTTPAAAASQPAPPVPMPNGSGTALTFSSTGFIDTTNPFFKSFGNGRSCASCHREGQGWSVTPEGLADVFTSTNGSDPIFQLVDGANTPLAQTATLDQKRIAYSMLLTKGLIRVGLPMPDGAEFSLVKTDDPYGFASAKELSLFRRPLPTTNLKFATTVMWDARETQIDPGSGLCITGSAPLQCFAPLDTDLLHQANSAVRGHAQAAQDLTSAEQQAIVAFEKSLFTAQITDSAAGSLVANGATGGPLELSKNNFYFGINDVATGDYKTGAAFTPTVMRLYGAWNTPPGAANPPPADPVRTAQASIARGEAIFNTKPITISGVAGFNDVLKLPQFKGTCTSCHSTPNSGSHSVPRLMNTGTSDGTRRTPDMPLYTLQNKTTGETIETMDPAAALLSGKWQDIGRVKVPSLRALEARSPYFHNGSAQELGDLIKFYDTRFNIGFTAQETADLTAFLKAL